MNGTDLDKALASLVDQGMLERQADGSYVPTALGRTAVIIENAADDLGG